jgi:DNA polymerase
MNPAEELEKVAQEARVCTKCELQFSRKLAVPGEGPANADIMFIGEGPGFHENEQGRPFVGAAGKLLDDLLAKINMKRSDVFITNVVKCRPPGNRDPQPDEIDACSEYLERQMEAIQPKVVVTLGRHSLGRFLPNAKISEVHGQAKRVKGRLVVAMYHPAAGLHQRSLMTAIEQDFKRLPELIAKATQMQEEPDQKPPEKNEPKQLNLF